MSLTARMLTVLLTVEVGDGLQMMIITKDGIEEHYSSLKKD